MSVAKMTTAIASENTRKPSSLAQLLSVYPKMRRPDEWRENDPAQTAKLDALKQELRANHIIGPDFLNPHDLAANALLRGSDRVERHNEMIGSYIASLFS